MTGSVLVVRRFVRRLLFQTLHDVALMLGREQAGREVSPAAGVIDSETSKLLSIAAQVGRRAHIRVKMRWRRLVRDYEERSDVSEAVIGVAMSSLMLRRIAHP